LTRGVTCIIQVVDMAQKDRFTELLSRVAREVTLRQASEVCCGDLTLEQFQTLSSINTADESSIGSLSSSLRVDLSTMSRNVTVLERNGYLVKARSLGDARIVQVKLTPKGKRALHTLRCGERDVLGDVFDCLSPVDRPKIVEALESLIAGFLLKVEHGSACCPPVIAKRGTA
jgi:DNA-binding MarR family transcriptional regulator